MKTQIRVVSALLVLLLSACENRTADNSSDSFGANHDRLSHKPKFTTESIVALARNSEDTHEQLDSICSRVNPDGVSVNNVTVGLVTDVGSIDDGTFNQAAFSGMEAASRCFGMATTFLESAGDDEAAQIQSLVDRKVDIIVAVGFRFQQATAKAAKAQPQLRFIGVDQVNPDKSPNFVAISFRDDQVGFLAGAMAGLITDSGSVGIIAGPDSIPPVVAIADGFEAGVRHVLPEGTVLRRHLDSFNDPQSGAAQASTFIAQGVDVLFGAAGDTGTGATRAAAAKGAFVIGVDQDEYYTTFSGGAAANAGQIATSAIKRVDLGVFLTLAAMGQGGIKGGDFLLDAANGGVTYAPFHQAKFPAIVGSKLEALRLELAEGEINPATIRKAHVTHSNYD